MLDEMNKFDNYIYYTICEKTLELAKRTRYRTHSTFCQGFKNSMLMESFDRREMAILYEIHDHLRVMYGLDGPTTNDYIVVFFIDEKWLIFEESVRLMKEYFPNSFN